MTLIRKEIVENKGWSFVSGYLSQRYLNLILVMGGANELLNLISEAEKDKRNDPNFEKMINEILFGMTSETDIFGNQVIPPQ